MNILSVSSWLACLVAASAQATTAVIRPAPGTGFSGTAPFAVHVDALGSSLSAGVAVDATYQWEFLNSSGAPDGEYPKLAGFNAAHLFEAPGTYTIRLTVVDKSGVPSAPVTSAVTVAADARPRIYVADNGSDARTGLSKDQAVKSLSVAAGLLKTGYALALRRGDTFTISDAAKVLKVPGTARNVLIESYDGGNGSARPLIYYTGAKSYAALIGLASGNADVVIRSIGFKSNLGGAINGVTYNGTNVTVKDCDFTALDYAFHSGSATGFLMLDNVATLTDEYFLFGHGTHHALIHNKSDGSYNAHIVRTYADMTLGHANDFNTLTTSARGVFAFAHMHYAYASSNTLRGVLDAGYHAAGAPGGPDIYQNSTDIVFEGNYVEGPGPDVPGGAVIQIYPTRNVMIRNNVINNLGGLGMNILVKDSNFPDPYSSHIVIVNNTGLNSGDKGTFIRFGGAPENANDVIVANNLNVQKTFQLHPLGYNPVNVAMTSSGFFGFKFQDNVWQKPTSTTYTCEHKVGADTCVTAAEWASHAEVARESYAITALTGYAPPAGSVAAASALPYPGVLNDYYRRARPAGGPWTAGAVEVNSGSTSTSAPPTITSQPVGKTVAAGQTATFSVTATGTPAPSYQWRRNGAAISGATSASYTTPAVTDADNGASFSCRVSNSAGSVDSNAAVLTVGAAAGAPAIASLTLVGGNLSPDIGTLVNGGGYMMPAGATLNVRANTVPATIGSVRFVLDGAARPFENIAPYSMMGDGAGYVAWTPAAGQHTITATPYSGANGTGTAGPSVTVSFYLFGTATATPSPLQPIGGVLLLRTVEPSGRVVETEPKALLINARRAAGQSLVFAPDVAEIRFIGTRGQTLFSASSASGALVVPLDGAARALPSGYSILSIRGKRSSAMAVVVAR